ncbi:HupE/UreJ family protein [Verrucomicrobiota bacterium sgz303538]
MRSFVRFVCILVVWLCAVLPAGAHPMLQNKLWVLLAPNSVKVAVDVSVKELTVAQLLQPEADGSIDPDMLASAAEYHGDYVLRHLHVLVGSQELAGKITKLTPPPQTAEPEITFYQYELEYPLAGARPEQVALRHEMLQEFPYGPGQAWDVTYSIRWKNEGSTELQTRLLRMGQTAELPTGWQTPNTQEVKVQVNVARTLREYFWHGVMHILTGYDHLLFVAALVLATVTFWEMVKVIAAFTLAHTLTLILSVLDIVRLPSWIVEPVIAGSIVFVAVENLLFPKRAQSWIRLVVAFGFGLIHGLGFAGGLLEAMEGLPALGIGLAILAFSIGVEVGHQVVVLPLYGALRLGRANWTPAVDVRVLRYASALVSMGGLYFLVQTLHGA